jgi:hypothetical protein
MNVGQKQQHALAADRPLAGDTLKRRRHGDAVAAAVFKRHEADIVAVAKQRAPDCRDRPGAASA